LRIEAGKLDNDNDFNAEADVVHCKLYSHQDTSVDD
jgi:hypothetical protein